MPAPAPSKQANKIRLPLDSESSSPGIFPTTITTTALPPVQRVTQRTRGFWVNGTDLSQTEEDPPTRGLECDIATFFAARAAAVASSTVRVPRGPIHVSWASHLSSHLSGINPAIPKEEKFPELPLMTISSQVALLLEQLFGSQYTAISALLAFVVTQLRSRRQEVEAKYTSMEKCKTCLEASNTGKNAKWYSCLVGRELKQDLLANDEKLIQVLRETVVILVDASHPNNPLASYSVSSLREARVETFVLAAFLIALGESEGHTENHARLAIDVLSASLPEGHRYRAFMNPEFLNRAMAEMQGYRRSYVKFPL